MFGRRPHTLAWVALALALLGGVALLLTHGSLPTHNPWAELPGWVALGAGLLLLVFAHWRRSLEAAREGAARELRQSERISAAFWRQAEAKRREVEELNALLEGVAVASQRLLDSHEAADGHDHRPQRFLEQLGQHARADRANYFEYHPDPAGGGMRVSQCLEWCAPGVPSVIERSQNLSPKRAWLERLEAGRPVTDALSAAEPALRDYFRERQIRSFLVVPVFIGRRLHGLLGLHDCREERPWSERTLAALQIAAASLSAYLQSNQSRHALAYSEQRYKSLYLEAEAHKRLQDKQNRLLNATLAAGEALLQREFGDEELRQALEILGRAMDADTAYVERVRPGGPDGPQVRDYLTWTAGGGPPAPGFQGERPGYQPWLEELQTRGHLAYGQGQYPPDRREFLLAQGTLSFVEAPVWVDGQLWGLFGFESRAERDWSPEEIGVAQSAARALGEAVQRGQYLQNLRQTKDQFRELYTQSVYRNHLLQTLVEISQAAPEWADVQQVEAEILGKLGRAVGVERVSVSQYHARPEGGQTRYSFSDWLEWLAPGAAPAAPQRRQNAEGYAPWISRLLGGETLTAGAEQYPSEARHLSDLGIRSLLIVPVVVEGRVWGGIGFGDGRARNWAEEEVALLKTAAALLGGMIERDRQWDQLEEASGRHLRLYEEGQHLNRLLRAIAEMSRASWGADAALIEGRMLPGLGQAAGASRVYLNQYHPHPDTGTTVLSLRQEWCAPGVAPQLGRPGRQNIPLYGPWVETIRGGRPLQARSGEFPAERRYLIEEEDIASLLLVPVTVGGEVWGSLGLDDCARERTWTEQEVGALQTAAALIGGVLERSRAFLSLAESERQNREQARQLELLLSFRQALSLDLEPASAVRRSVELVAETFGYNLASIYLREGDALVMQHQVGYSQWLGRVPIAGGVMSRCVLSGQPVMVEDASRDPDFVYPMPDIRSNIAVPLQVEGQTVGVLNVESRDLALGPSDLRLLQSIGVQIGLILERARSVQRLLEGEQTNRRLLEQTRQQAAQLELLLKLRDALTEAEDTQTILRRFVEEVHHSFGYGLVAVYWREGREMVARHHLGYDLNHRRIPLGQGVTGRCARTAQPILIQDPAQDPDFLVVNDRVISAMFVPLTVTGQVVGTVNIESEDRRFEAQDLELLVAVAAQLNLVLERNQAFVSLAQSETRFRTLVENLPDGILLLDAQADRITYANPSALELLRAPAREALVGQPIRRIWLGEHLERNRQRAGQLAEGLTKLPWLEQPLRALDGSRVEVECTAVRVPSGDQEYFVSIVRDIGERRAAQRRIEYLAFRDALTGLYNRAALAEQSESLLEAGGASLVYFDLNDFKMINDAYGHEVGDRLLQQVAQRLLQIPLKRGLLARVGGDEFVVLDGVSAEDTALLTAKVQAIFDRPFLIEGHELRVASSLGVAQFPQHADGLQGLMRAADVAMYQAKSAGQPACLYRPELDRDVLERLELLQDLHRALETGEIEPHFQPIVALQDGGWSKVEVLSRWHDPKRGSVSPERFIRLAEDSGLIRQLDRQVLRAALGLVRHLELDVAANISPKTLLDDEFVPWVEGTLAALGVGPGRLWLEITEALVMDNPALAKARLEGLRRLGVRVALDDFGSGYSSMSYLKDLPVDLVKVDRKFVWDIGRSRRAEDILRGMISLSRNLGLPVLAEGVETPEQAAWLLEAGCTFAQGYLYGRPQSYAALAQRIERPVGA